MTPRALSRFPIRSRLTDEESPNSPAQRYRFPGVDIKARLFRTYPLRNRQPFDRTHRSYQPKRKKRSTTPDDAANYRGTEVMGKAGLKRAMSCNRCGQTGWEEMETSAGGHAVRRLEQSPRHAGTQPAAVGGHQAAEDGGRPLTATAAA